MQIIFSVPREYHTKVVEMADAGHKSMSQLFRDWVDREWPKFKKQQEIKERESCTPSV